MLPRKKDEENNKYHSNVEEINLLAKAFTIIISLGRLCATATATASASCFCHDLRLDNN